MTQFVRTVSGNLINTAAIRRIEHTEKGSYIAYDMEGDRIGQLDWSFCADVFAPTIPAGYRIDAACVSCYYHSSLETPPTIDDVYVEMLPIIAWRFNYAVPCPVFFEDQAKETLILLPIGDDRWTLPFEMNGTLNDFKQMALRDAQESWEHEREARAKALENATHT